MPINYSEWPIEIGKITIFWKELSLAVDSQLFLGSRPSHGFPMQSSLVSNS